MRRIVVTGMGLVGPLGSGTEISWKRLLDGKSGIRNLPDEISNDLPVKIGGIVPSVNGGVKTGHGAEQKSATVAPA